MTTTRKGSDMSEDDGWTGSMKKPWLNPPHNRELGARRGPWALAMVVIALTVAAVFTVLLLVRADQLDRGWAYAVIPVGIIAAATAGLLTVFKASAESRKAK